jgi:hypothetical protein
MSKKQKEEKVIEELEKEGNLKNRIARRRRKI